MKEISEQDLSNIKNIVFIDDFCGTGKTFKDYIESVGKIVQGKHIYYLVIHIMDMYGNIYSVNLYDENAQKFVVDNLDNILRKE